MLTLISLQKNGAAPKDYQEISDILIKNKIKHSILFNKGAREISLTINNLRNSIAIKTYPSNKLGFIFFTATLLRPIFFLKKINKLNSKILFCTHFHPWLIFVFLKKYLNKKWQIIYGVHENPFTPKEGHSFFINILEKFFLKNADYIFAHSRYLAEELNKKITKNIIVTPIGPYKSMGEDREASTKNFFSEELSLLFLGRIEPYKGLDTLLLSYEKLKNTGLKISLTIAGDGKIEKNLMLLIKKNKIKLLNFWLNENDIKNILEQTHVLVVPYKKATQSGVISLGIAKKIPIITSNAGGLSEQIKNNINGIVFEKGDYIDLAKKIKYFYDNRNVLEKIANHQKLIDNSWQETAKSIKNILSTLK